MTQLKISRRGIFAGTALCGLAGTITSCSPAQPPVATVPSTPAPPSDPARVLVAANEVPVGGGVLVPGAQPVVVVQPAAGTFKAFDAKCPHMGAVVAAPDSAGTLVCPAHKARFHPGDGSRLSGPAQQGLTPVAIEVVEGQIRLATPAGT